jgi:molecular chaperone GrpE (heat shock protein)
MRSLRKEGVLKKAASRVDFTSERYYNISFGFLDVGSVTMPADQQVSHSLHEYQTELNRIRVEMFRLQRNVKSLQMPALEVVGLDRVAEDIESLKAELRRLLGRMSDLANLEPMKSAIGGFLEVADSCERVLSMARKTEGIPDSVLKGVDSIYRLLLAKLKRVGVEQMEAISAFDPNRQLALATVEDPAKPEGSIAEVQLAGYMIGSQVLRPAQVVIVRNRPASAAKVV